MRLTFDLTAGDLAAQHNPFAPTPLPERTLDLDGLAGLLAARIGLAADVAAAAMTAAHRGLARVEDVDAASALDDLTLTLAREDVSGRDGSRFPVPVVRVRLTHEPTFAEATVRVDAAGKLPPFVRMGNLTTAAFPDGVSGDPLFAQYRAELVAALVPDVFGCEELVGDWSAELPADAAIVGGGLPVPEYRAAEVLERLLRAAVSGSAEASSGSASAA